ncbi:MAG TPA: ABC transporter substrate-binding protein, partial [Mycobacteriales bacterium]|nr:ABC transporter substrate-binding protein [Mycobacteriales bacterium]
MEPPVRGRRQVVGGGDPAVPQLRRGRPGLGVAGRPGRQSLGNTQDVALRTWLGTKGYKTTTEGGGDVTIVPQDNSLTLTAFESGAIDGAWVPEPYATQLQQEGGKILVNEAT